METCSDISRQMPSLSRAPVASGWLELFLLLLLPEHVVLWSSGEIISTCCVTLIMVCWVTGAPSDLDHEVTSTLTTRMTAFIVCGAECNIWVVLSLFNKSFSTYPQFCITCWPTDCLPTTDMSFTLCYLPCTRLYTAPAWVWTLSTLHSPTSHSVLSVSTGDAPEVHRPRHTPLKVFSDTNISSYCSFH